MNIEQGMLYLKKKKLLCVKKKTHNFDLFLHEYQSKNLKKIYFFSHALNFIISIKKEYLLDIMSENDNQYFYYLLTFFYNQKYLLA